MSQRAAWMTPTIYSLHRYWVSFLIFVERELTLPSRSEIERSQDFSASGIYYWIFSGASGREKDDILYLKNDEKIKF